MPHSSFVAMSSPALTTRAAKELCLSSFVTFFRVGLIIIDGLGGSCCAAGCFIVSADVCNGIDYCFMINQIKISSVLIYDTA